MDYIKIDGGQGEGGGQVLRTALTLSMLTQRSIEIINIRAGRKKPGLLRQHLTCVLAAQSICSARVEGAELGSGHIRFTPGVVKAGNYKFAIGTAGSTVLVCQTILPVLALADAESTLILEGGTHNGMSPSLSFFQLSYLPLLSLMGAYCRVKVSRLGFYPAGGGKWQLDITPSDKLKPLSLHQAGSKFAQQIENCAMSALVSNLPQSIGQREILSARKALNWPEVDASVKCVDSLGPGNIFQLSITGDTHKSVFEVVGELRSSAQKVAKRAAGRVRKFLHANAAVEEYLADQLLLLIAIAGKGSFTTTKPSLHCTTNIDVIKQVLGVEIAMEPINDVLWRIYLGD